jgi:hypothetical protein
MLCHYNSAEEPVLFSSGECLTRSGVWIFSRRGGFQTRPYKITKYFTLCIYVKLYMFKIEFGGIAFPDRFNNVCSCTFHPFGQPRGDCPYASPATRHTSHVTRHTLHVTRYTLHVTHYALHITHHASRITQHPSPNTEH